MNIIIKSILIQGYRSIENLYLDFTKFNGLTLIEGPNGSGKSSIIEALCWGIYGKIPRNKSVKTISTLEAYRTHIYRGTMVKVCLTIEYNNISTDYEIIRTLKYTGDINVDFAALNDYSGVVLYENGKQVKFTDKKGMDIQICNILQVNYQVFVNSILFSQRVRRFSELSNTERRDSILSYIDLKWIDDSYEAVSLRLVNNEITLAELRKELNNNIQSKIRYENLKETYEKNQILFEEEINNKLLQIEMKLNDILQYEKSHNVVTQVPEQLDTTLIDDKITNIRLEINSLNKEIQSNKVQIATKEQKYKQYLIDKENIEKRIAHTKKDVYCPMCSSKLNNEKHSEILVLLDNELNSIINRIELEKSNITSLLNTNNILTEKLDNLYSIADELESEHNNLISSYKYKMGLYIDYQQQSKIKNSLITEKEMLLSQEYKKPDADYDYMISQCSSAISSIEIEIEKNTNLNKGLIYWKSIGFNNKGLKADLTISLISSINSRLKYYGQFLGMSGNLSIRDDVNKGFDLKCFNRDGNIIEYEDLSGGEKSRIDFSINLAMHDLLKACNCNFNLLFMDEVFDNLDSEGFTSVISLLKNKTQEGINIFIISFSLDSCTLGCNSIRVSKTDKTLIEI